MIAARLSQPAPGWLSDGARVYAIGDVHGCDARLAALHAAVADDLARDLVARPLLLHVGDYVDRGPDSAGVVRRLAAGSPVPGCATVCLRGNHEQMLLDALALDGEAAAHWMENGAAPTWRSWGVTPGQPIAALRHAMREEMPFLQALPLRYAVDGYIFVHAGVRPGVALARQTTDDLLWIREPFLHYRGPLLPDAPATAVVHGHTPARRPEITRTRINVDTGAVAGGDLTCAVLQGRTVRLLTA